MIQKQGFIDCIKNYVYYEYNNGGSYTTTRENDFIRDVSDGIAYRKANRQINEQFQLLVEDREVINDLIIDEHTIQIKLIFSLFYDGVQIYNNKSVSCLPLTLTILNLPPNLRSIQGVGTLLLSLVSIIIL